MQRARNVDSITLITSLIAKKFHYQDPNSGYKSSSWFLSPNSFWTTRFTKKKNKQLEASFVSNFLEQLHFFDKGNIQ